MLEMMAITAIVATSDHAHDERGHADTVAALQRGDRLDVDRLLVDRVYRGLRGSGRLDRCGRLGFDGSDGRLHGDGGLHGLHGVLNRCAAAAAERSAFLDGGAAVGTE